MNHVPVRSNGALGRAFLRFAGASAPSCAGWPAFCATAVPAAIVRTTAPARAVATTRILLAAMCPPRDILIAVDRHRQQMETVKRLSLPPHPQVNQKADAEDADHDERHLDTMLADVRDRALAVPERQQSFDEVARTAADQNR